MKYPHALSIEPSMSSPTLQEELRLLEEQMAELMSEQKKQTETSREVEAEAKLMERRLEAACKLIDGLESERRRWTEDHEACSDTRTRLVGSCLIGAAFLSYAGPYTLEFRNRMVSFGDSKRKCTVAGRPGGCSPCVA